MSQKIEKMVEKKNQIPTSFTAVTMKSQQLSIPALGPQSSVLINIQARVEEELNHLLLIDLGIGIVTLRSIPTHDSCHLRWMVQIQGSHGWPWLNQMNHKTHDSEKETGED